MQWNFEIIPPLVQKALIRYRDTGCPVGSFTQAVLAGNLYEACRRGDDASLEALPTIAVWIERNMPGASYGSQEHYKGWIKLFDNLLQSGKRNVRYDRTTGKLTFEEALQGEEESQAAPI